MLAVGSAIHPATLADARVAPTAVTVFAYSGSNNPTKTVASLPSNVRGVSWLFSWNKIEPTAPVKGVPHFNWKPIDQALAAAQASGRTSMIRVIAGRDSPSWVGPSVTFTYQPGGPMPEATITMPIPWSSGFLTDWTAFIRAYGARYNGDRRIYAVQMPGAGVLGEMALPKSVSPANIWTNPQAPPRGVGSDTYTSAKIIGAWDKIINAYRGAFPSTRTALDIGEPLGSTTVMPAVLAHAQTYGDNIFLQQNGLQGSTSPTSTLALILKGASATTTVGWQEWGGNNTASNLKASFVTAIATHASYVEVYLDDCTNPKNAPAIRYLVAHSA